MKIYFYFLLLFATSGLLSCNKDNNLKGDSCASNTGALKITHDNLEREYLVHIPASYNASNPTPVLFNFHGFGGSASSYMNTADMRSIANTENFILVYPQGSCLDGSSHWNTSPMGPGNKSTADDFGFIEALIAQLNSQYNVDEERIYACGYSNGGMFSYGLALFKSDLIAAVGSVSGTMVDMNGNTTHPIPMINLHGTSDGTIPYNGNADYNSIPSVINYWTDFNNTDVTPTISNLSSGSLNIEHSLYENGDSLVSVEHYKVIGGSHVWFNLDVNGKNTGQIIWDFVSKYDINGLM